MPLKYTRVILQTVAASFLFISHSSLERKRTVECRLICYDVLTDIREDLCSMVLFYTILGRIEGLRFSETETRYQIEIWTDSQRQLSFRRFIEGLLWLLLSSRLWSAVSQREREESQAAASPVCGQAQPLARAGLTHAHWRPGGQWRPAVQCGAAASLERESGQCQSPEVRAGVTTVWGTTGQCILHTAPPPSPD